MNNLKSIRKSKGLFQSVVAMILNITTNSYSRYERDVHKMDPDTLIKLSKYFNISVDYIIGNIDEPVTLDEMKFFNTVGTSKLSDEEIMSKYIMLDDDGQPATKKDIKEILEMLKRDQND